MSLENIENDMELQTSKQKKIKICRVLSLLPTLVFIITFFIPKIENDFLDTIVLFGILALILVGWIAAPMTGAKKYFRKIFKPAAGVFGFCLAIPIIPFNIIAALIFGATVMCLMLWVAAFFPIIFTFGE